jgi:hypothetical protein
LLIAASATVVLATGRFTVGTQTGTAARPNMATLHFAALLMLVLGLPVWLAALPAAARRVANAVRSHPVRAVAGAMGLAIVIAVLARTFANPHIWNRELFWAGCTFTLLRNWPLVWIDHHAWLRWASAANVVLMSGALASVIARQRSTRRGLLLALACGAVLPLANNLVEPRYFIPALAFVLLLAEIDAANGRRLAAWWALLGACHAPFIARGLSLW